MNFMGLIDSLKKEVCYFRFELNENLLKELNLDCNKKYMYARMFNHGARHNVFFGLFMCAVYDFFTENPLKEIKAFIEKDFLFNQKISLKPPSKGALKWTLIDKKPLSTFHLEKALPHMVFTHFVENDNDIVNYFKDGIYDFYPNTKRYSTEYKNLKHLEDEGYTDTFQIRENVYLELIKRQNKNHTEKELKKMLIAIKGDEWGKMNERQKRIALRDFLFIYKQPLYKDIPKKYRERAINEVK